MSVPLPVARRTACASLAVAAAALCAPAAAQPPTVPRPTPADSLATVRVAVRHGDAPVEGAIARALDLARPIGAQTDARGTATLRLPPGDRRLVVGRLGARPDTLRLTLRAGQDTSLVVQLADEGAEVEAVVVTATRGERRVEDTPLRVEVIDEEEIAEKVAMTPGDVAMMLNETSGLRVQTTNPSLGAASVRVQGLRGRYSLLLADGLPLYGGQAGGLGLLQIPPIDLARVEVIKGTASALYGSSALGGVIDLVSRRPGRTPTRTALVNGTSRGGADGVFFGTGPLGARWGYTLLAGAHGQRRSDLDDDGWADVPGYERGVVRPRLYFDDGAGRAAFLTGGLTAEDRDGGTLDGRTVPVGAAGGVPFVEGLRTRRGDLGALARWVVADGAGPAWMRGSILTLRGSGVEQRHDHRFGPVRERDTHRTWFGEASLAVPRAYRDRHVTYVAGVAFQRDVYHADDVAGFDYAHAAPAAFAQVDVDPTAWLALSTSARLDAHAVYGTSVSPRVSVLLRRPAGDADAPLAGWTTRLSAGAGVSAPTPFTDETEATGLSTLEPLRALVAERARSLSLDVGGPVATALGRLEVNATAFGSRIRRPLLARDVAPAPGSTVPRLALANATLPTVTWGADAFARLRIADVLSGELGFVGTYVYLRSTEEDPDRGGRRAAPLTPRHAAGLDVIWEAEGRGRVGLELYHTGRQSLDDNPYRSMSRPYTVLGLLAEWRVHWLRNARAFVNGENLGGVRQTRWDPLVLPSRGRGGRWTTAAWTETAGATVNAGLRVELGGRAGR